MALESAFQDLSMQYLTLRDALIELRLTVVQDKPDQADLALVDVLGDTIDNLMGWLHEAITAVAESQRSLQALGDLHHARRGLVNGQSLFNRIDHQFSLDMLRFDRIAELDEIAHERGGEWGVWARDVKDTLDWCREPLFNVRQAHLTCWQELTERIGTTYVSLQPASAGRSPTSAGNVEAGASAD